MKKPLDVSILATSDAEPGVIFGIYDALWAAGLLWNRVMGEAEAPVFAPHVVGETGVAIETVTGALIQPHRSIADDTDTDIVFIPSLLADFDLAFAARNAALIDWLRNRYEAGTHIVSSCTGSFVLAASGLLDTREATTHWAFVDKMKTDYPAINVRGDRIVVAADEEARIVTAGGASSWTDLVLYLTGRFGSPEDARRLAKMSLFDWHHGGQNPYARLTTGRHASDAVIADLQTWLAEHYASTDIVAAMSARSGLAPKTLARRFRAATGYAPLDYVQTLRIEEAKQQLETTNTPVEAVAESVGYHDPSSFVRLFKRRVGETPAAYRRRVAMPEFIATIGQA